MADERQGIEFKANSLGRISTTEIGKAIWAASMTDINDSAAAQILAEPNWRKNYVNHVPGATITALRRASHSTTMAAQGLAAAYEHFIFTRDGASVPLMDAMANPTKGYFASFDIQGTAPDIAADFELPYKNQDLTGADLNNQLDRWVDTCVIETDFAELIKQANRKDERLDLRGQKFVLLGASSEMGPIKFLLNHGAHVIAVDIDRKHIWQRLIDITRHSPGKLSIPLREKLKKTASDEEIIAQAGANLLTETPEIADWLMGFKGKLTIGSYAYLDAANHVRVVMGMDAIIAQLLSADRTLALAYLMTPTDVYTVPAKVIKTSQLRDRKLTWRKPIKMLLRLLSFQQWFSPNISFEVETEQGVTVGLVDTLVNQQGPNYNLAKRIQRWRAVDSVKRGMAVSCNVAPATATRSVTKNRIFSAGYAGAEQFGVEIFQPTTSCTIMALAMVLELKQADQTKPVYANPEELFMTHSCHSGMWTNPNQLRSILAPGVVIGFVTQIFSK